MNVEEVRSYALSLPSVTEDSPYGDDMIVFRIAGKIFLHLPLEYADPRMVIKLPPQKGEALRDRYSAITAPYHMNKVHWNEILIDGYFDDCQLQAWIRESYALVFAKLPLKVRQQYPQSADVIIP